MIQMGGEFRLPSPVAADLAEDRSGWICCTDRWDGGN